MSDIVTKLNATGVCIFIAAPEAVARDVQAVCKEATGEIERLEADKNAVYGERNQVVAALAKLFPSGIAKTEIEGWDPEWHGCVYIDLPTGQVSWHYHDRLAYLFADLPPYTKPWDGHSTDEKYQRLAALSPNTAVHDSTECKGIDTHRSTA